MAIGPQYSNGTSNWWYPQYPYYPSPQPYPHNMGWSCPRCGRVWAPNISSCDCTAWYYQSNLTWTSDTTYTIGSSTDEIEGAPV